MQYEDFYTALVASSFGEITFQCNMCNEVHTLSLPLSERVRFCGHLLSQKVQEVIGENWALIELDVRLLAVDIKKVTDTLNRIVETKTEEKIDGIKITWL